MWAEQQTIQRPYVTSLDEEISTGRGEDTQNDAAFQAETDGRDTEGPWEAGLLGEPIRRRGRYRRSRRSGESSFRWPGAWSSMLDLMVSKLRAEALAGVRVIRQRGVALLAATSHGHGPCKDQRDGALPSACRFSPLP